MLKGHCYHVIPQPRVLYLVSLSHANLSDFGPDTVLMVVHAQPPRGLTPTTAGQILAFILNGLTACCNEFFAGPKCSGDLISSTLCLRFRCSFDQSRLVIDSGKSPASCNPLLIT